MAPAGDDLSQDRQGDAVMPGNAVRTLLHGIPVTTLASPDGARIVVADHGAHVLSWQPAGGEEMLYLSPMSGYGAGQAIRGGVPVIFPQFGERGHGRRHGVARLQSWQFQGARQDEDSVSGRWQMRGLLDGKVATVQEPETTTEAKAMAKANPRRDSVAGAFLLTLAVRLAGARLILELRIDNVGDQPWQAHAALHTYLKVFDLPQTRVDGLQHVAYLDNALPTTGGSFCAGETVPLCFAGEVDRLYCEVPGAIRLTSGAQRISLTQSGFAEAVLWNPGSVKGRALPDLPKDGYTGFVCIEAACVLQPVALAPGASWHGWQQLHADHP